MDGTNIGPYFPPDSHPWRQQKSPVREQTSKQKAFGMMFYHLCQKNQTSILSGGFSKFKKHSFAGVQSLLF